MRVNTVYLLIHEQSSYRNEKKLFDGFASEMDWVETLNSLVGLMSAAETIHYSPSTLPRLG